MTGATEQPEFARGRISAAGAKVNLLLLPLLLGGRVKDGRNVVNALVDSGASHSFVGRALVTTHGGTLAVEAAPAMQVTLADGSEVTSE